MCRCRVGVGHDTCLTRGHALSKECPCFIANDPNCILHNEIEIIMIHQQMKSACYQFLPRINEANRNKKGVHDTQRQAAFSGIDL